MFGCWSRFICTFSMNASVYFHGVFFFSSSLFYYTSVLLISIFLTVSAFSSRSFSILSPGLSPLISASPYASALFTVSPRMSALSASLSPYVALSFFSPCVGLVFSATLLISLVFCVALHAGLVVRVAVFLCGSLFFFFLFLITFTIYLLNLLKNYIYLPSGYFSFPLFIDLSFHYITQMSSHIFGIIFFCFLIAYSTHSLMCLLR